MADVSVPDIPAPVATLCWKQASTMARCDRKAGHTGLHSWEAAALEAHPIEPGYLCEVADRIIETNGCVSHDWLVGVAKAIKSRAAKCPALTADLIRDARVIVMNDGWGQQHAVRLAVAVLAVAERCVYCDRRAGVGPHKHEFSPKPDAHTLTLQFERFLSEAEWREVAELAWKLPYVKGLRADAVALKQPDGKEAEVVLVAEARVFTLEQERDRLKGLLLRARLILTQVEASGDRIAREIRTDVDAALSGGAASKVRYMETADILADITRILAQFPRRKTAQIQTTEYLDVADRSVHVIPTPDSKADYLAVMRPETLELILAHSGLTERDLADVIANHSEGSEWKTQI